jgi:hypothetical protein
MTPSVQNPTRTLRLLSWDKRINAGMLHITHEGTPSDGRTVNGKCAVYYVRRLDAITPTFQFTKLQPTEGGLIVQAPYTVHVYTTRKHTGTEVSGVCHCAGYKNRKECRHADAAIAMINEYNV